MTTQSHMMKKQCSILLFALLYMLASSTAGFADSLKNVLPELAQKGGFQFVIDAEAVADIDITVTTEASNAKDTAIKAAATAGLEVFNCGDILVFYPPARRDHWLAWMGYQAFIFEKASFKNVAQLLIKRFGEIGFKVTIEIDAAEKMFFVTASPFVLSMVEHVAYLIERKSMNPEAAVAEVFKDGDKLVNVSASGIDLSVLAPGLAEKLGVKTVCDEVIEGEITCYLQNIHYRLALELLARAGTAVVYHRDDGLHIEQLRFP